MKQKKIMASISLALVVVTTGSFAIPNKVNAEVVPEKGIDISSNSDSESIKVLGKFVTVNNNKYVLNLSESDKVNYSEDLIKLAQNQIYKTNRILDLYGITNLDVQKGSLIEEVSDSEIYKRVKNANIEGFDIANSSIAKSEKAAGVSKVIAYWWGVDVYMSKGLLTDIRSSSLSIASGILAAAIPGLAALLSIALGTFINLIFDKILPKPQNGMVFQYTIGVGLNNWWSQ